MKQVFMDTIVATAGLQVRGGDCSLDDGINVLSLFDGLSAGRLALQYENIKVGTYYRSEIDKYASQIAMHHFPNDVQLGDVTKWREWDIDWSSIDLLIGGSPCQGFSFAGKQAGTKAVLNGIETLVVDRQTYLTLKENGAEFLSQSHLFWEYVLILDHIKAVNPNVKFMLENVRMKTELLSMISSALGVKDIVINSSLVSAQNRHRHYWCNWAVMQPEDKRILLKDILEPSFNKIFCINPNVIDKYMQPNGKPKGFCADTGKSRCITASIHKGYGNDGATILSVSASDIICKTDSSSNDIHYRKLTPIECERLQTFPDNYTAMVSNTQRYKALGNSWTVEVIAHILGSAFNLSKIML